MEVKTYTNTITLVKIKIQVFSNSEQMHQIIVLDKDQLIKQDRKKQRRQEMFQKHLCPPWCKVQVYLLCRSKTCKKQVTKGLKYIKWTTHWAQKSSLILTFEHVT